MFRVSNTSHSDSLDWFKKKLLIRSKQKYVQKKNIIKKIRKYNMQMNYFKNWGWVIQKNVFINYFTMKMEVTTQR